MDTPKNSNVPTALLIATGVLLLVGVLPWPLGYYLFLRIVACITFVWLAINSWNAGKQSPAVILGIAAILFNPVVPIALGKDLWVLVDLIVGAFVLYKGLKQRKAEKTQA